MFCPKCGNQLPEGANFCPKCGAEFPKNKEENTQNTYQTNTQNVGNATGRIHRTARELRKEARRSLTEKWGKSALIMLAQGVIVFAIEFAISFIVILAFSGNSDSTMAENIARLIIFIVSAIIGVPLTYGITASFMKIKRGEEVKILDFWKIGFKNFARSWKVCLWIVLKMIGIIAIMYVGLIIIGALIALIAGSSGVSSGSNSGMLVIILLVTVIAMVAFFVFLIAMGLRFAIANNIAYDEPNITAKEAVEKSKKLMKGRKGDYAVLVLSFIGWDILALFTYGIGSLWLMPYTYVAKVCFYDHIREDEGI